MSNGAGWMLMAAALLACNGGESSDVGDSTTATEPPGSEGASESGASSPSATATGSSSDDGDGTTSSDDGPGPAGPHGEWQTRAPLSAARQETGVVALGGEIYVVGGFTPEGLVPRVEVYDPVGDAWRTAADFPDAGVHHANAAAVDGRLFVAGYLSGLGFGAVGRTFSYDPEADDWVEHAQLPLGTERGGSGVAVLGTRIYVLGGLRGGQSVADAWIYDTASDAWSPIEPLPSPRDHLAAAGVDGKVYAIGGRSGGITGHMPGVDIYDPDSNTWAPGPPMPTSRGGMAAAVVSHWIFVAGGEGNADEPTGVFAQFEVLDTNTGTWTTLTPMPTPRHGMGAAAIDGVVYVPGGADVQALGAVATHEAWVLG
jgi:N-acetylneuraminic acid mutarotase